MRRHTIVQTSDYNGYLFDSYIEPEGSLPAVKFDRWNPETCLHCGRDVKHGWRILAPQSKSDDYRDNSAYFHTKCIRLKNV